MSPLSHGLRRASSPKGRAKFEPSQSRYARQLSQRESQGVLLSILPPPMGEVAARRADGEGSPTLEILSKCGIIS